MKTLDEVGCMCSICVCWITRYLFVYLSIYSTYSPDIINLIYIIYLQVTLTANNGKHSGSASPVSRLIFAKSVWTCGHPGVDRISLYVQYYLLGLVQFDKKQLKITIFGNLSGRMMSKETLTPWNRSATKEDSSFQCSSNLGASRIYPWVVEAWELAVPVTSGEPPMMVGCEPSPTMRISCCVSLW